MPELIPLNLSVCVETMFLSMPFEQRMEHVAFNGFRAFEFWNVEGKDMNITQALQSALHIEVSAFNGSSASLVDPRQHDQLEQDIMHNASLAVDLSCSCLVLHSGNVIADLPRAAQHENIVKALKRVEPIARDAGVTLLLEPLNAIDNPGTYLTYSTEGFQIIREVNSPNVRLLFNIYHQQITEGNLTVRIVKNMDLVGYIRVADVPGRHEPNTGEINFPYLFKLLRARNFRGYVGLEYKPLFGDAESLRGVKAMAQ